MNTRAVESHSSSIQLHGTLTKDEKGEKVHDLISLSQNFCEVGTTVLLFYEGENKLGKLIKVP